MTQSLYNGIIILYYYKRNDIMDVLEILSKRLKELRIENNYSHVLNMMEFNIIDLLILGMGYIQILIVNLL